LNFTDVDFSGADLSNTVLNNLNFTDVDFSGADLSNTVLNNLNFTDVDFSGAYLNVPPEWLALGRSPEGGG
jgi:uncharacterized protein YjbI with pentapeptide repeats